MLAKQRLTGCVIKQKSLLINQVPDKSCIAKTHSLEMSLLRLWVRVLALLIRQNLDSYSRLSESESALYQDPPSDSCKL